MSALQMEQASPSPATPRTLVQVGSRYGVRDFMRSIDSSWRSGMDTAPWVLAAQAALKAKMPAESAAGFVLADLLSSPAGQAVMSHSTTQGRRLGKSYVDVHSQIGQTAVLELDGREDEGVVLLDCLLHVEKDRTIGTISPGRFVMTRHALERLYEREGVPTGGLAEAIRHTLADVRRSIAFGVTAGLTIGEVPDAHALQPEDDTALGALQVVPCSSGLLVVEVLLCIALRDDYPAIRLETRRSGTFGRGSPRYDPRILEIQQQGVSVQVAPMHIGRTYLSWDILRPEQREYAVEFRRMSARANLEAAARQIFGTRDVHRTDRREPAIEMPDVSSLHRLLPHCATLSSRNFGIWSMRPGRIGETADECAAMRELPPGMDLRPRLRQPRHHRGR